jgi:hypothetical protein
MLGCSAIGSAIGCYPIGWWFKSTRPSLYIAVVVQLVEQLICNQ